MNWLTGDFSSLVNVPTLVGPIVAVVVDDVPVVSVRGTVDIKALSAVVFDVLHLSREVLDSLGGVVLELSHDNCNINIEVLASLIRKGHVSVLRRSNGVGSRVECEPLFDVTGMVVSNSQSELLSTDVFSFK